MIFHFIILSIDNIVLADGLATSKEPVKKPKPGPKSKKAATASKSKSKDDDDDVVLDEPNKKAKPGPASKRKPSTKNDRRQQVQFVDNIKRKFHQPRNLTAKELVNQIQNLAQLYLWQFVSISLLSKIRILVLVGIFKIFICGFASFRVG